MWLVSTADATGGFAPTGRGFAWMNVVGHDALSRMRRPCRRTSAWAHVRKPMQDSGRGLGARAIGFGSGRVAIRVDPDPNP